MDDEFLIQEIERCRKGFNPMMGEFRITVPGRAPSGQGGARQKESFRKRLMEAIGSIEWIFVHQVGVQIELLLDHQSILESDEVCDLDNYAKAIGDSLKGLDGIVIDDCQFHRLDICWVDCPGPTFEKVVLEFRAAPDDFMIKPIELFELADGLYYPFSKRNWSREGSVPVSDEEYVERRLKADAAAMVKKALRHKARQAGQSCSRAFQQAHPLTDLLSQSIDPHAYVWGFHRSRAAASGFPCTARPDWLSKLGLKDSDLKCDLGQPIG